MSVGFETDPSDPELANRLLALNIARTRAIFLSGRFDAHERVFDLELDHIAHMSDEEWYGLHPEFLMGRAAIAGSNQTDRQPSV